MRGEEKSLEDPKKKTMQMKKNRDNTLLFI